MARMLKATIEAIKALFDGLLATASNDPEAFMLRAVILDAAEKSGYQFIEVDKLDAAIARLEANIEKYKEN